MKITRKQLRQIIKEELGNTVNESVADMAPMDILIEEHAGKIVDAFGEAMESLWDEDTAMMKQQGYTNRSDWYSQVGRAELALELRLQDDIAAAINEVEMELHGGGYYQDDVSSMGDDYPKTLGYTDPESGESVTVKVSSSDDMDDILDPLLRQYPDLPYSVD